MPEIFWEDLVEGEVKTSLPYTVTRDEILDFARNYDPQPMHLSEAAGKASMLGGLAASGWHTCSIMMRLLFDSLLARAAGLGSPGIEETRWSEPVFPEDVVHLRRTVTETRSSKSRPDRGLVTFKLELVKAKGSVACEIICVVIFARRNPGARLA